MDGCYLDNVDEDDVSVLPVRTTVEPEPSAVTPGSFRKVKFSSTKAYPAEIIAIG